MNSSSLLSIKQSLNKAYILFKPNRASTEVFKVNLVQLINQINEKESIENAKVYVQDLLAETYFTSDYSETENNSSPVCYAHVSGLREEFSDLFITETKKSDNYNNSLADASQFITKAANPHLKEAIFILKVCVKQILTDKLTSPQANTSDFDKQIDELIYQLYEFTPEEIAVLVGC